MEFQFGQTVTRERRRLAADPYSGGQAPGGWVNAETVELPGAFVASGSSSSLKSGDRSQAITAKSLYLSDPDADVLVGDRIRMGSSLWQIEAKPEADVNPFTGWQPVMEIPLVEVLG